MYQSKQYLEIGGKFIVCPFSSDDYLHGVNLHLIMCRLHESGARHVPDFKTVIMSSIESEIGLSEMDKAVAIYKRVMLKLEELGAVPEATTH